MSTNTKIEMNAERMNESTSNWNFSGVTLDKDKDLLLASDAIKLEDIIYKKGKVDPTRFLILAIPPNRCFETLCSSKSPSQCLEYLADKVDPSSPQFKIYASQLLKTFPSMALNKELEDRELLIDIVRATCDKELVLMYIKKILAHDLNFSDNVYGIPKGTERKIAKLFQWVRQQTW